MCGSMAYFKVLRDAAVIGHLSSQADTSVELHVCRRRSGLMFFDMCCVLCLVHAGFPMSVPLCS